MKKIEVKVPDIGDFDKVLVVDVFVKEGDRVEIEDALIALESDKATMEVPSSAAGVVKKVTLAVGDYASEGTTIIIVEGEPVNVNSENPKSNTEQEQSLESAVGVSKLEPSNAQIVTTGNEIPDSDLLTDLVVLGSGPGGYTAAFRAADLGLTVTLVERYDTLGGVCLNVGCIPSKALLHVAKVIEDSAAAEFIGIQFKKPKVDINKIGEWKNSVVNQLTKGLVGLAGKRKVNVVKGTGIFSGTNQIIVENDAGKTSIGFKQAIIAVGSQAIKIPGFPHDDKRVMDSTDALELEKIPSSLLVIGGGIIGLEMATVYHALGSKVSVVEMMGSTMAGVDTDIVRPLLKKIKGQYVNIWTSTKVTEMKAVESGIKVRFDGKDAPAEAQFDRVLVAVGRKPNGTNINAPAAGVLVNDRGFIEVDNQMRTNVPHIFAIGDVVGQPMLAHKAVHEAKVAAEVAAGLKSGFEARVIPSVAYTDPEVAWVGITETEAKEKGLEYEKSSFPWAASGRSLSQDRNEGVTKLLFDPETQRIIGAGITGNNAGELIAEAALAIEMNADAQDISLTIHAHPTLSETLGFAAEIAEGTITDLYMPKKKKK